MSTHDIPDNELDDFFKKSLEKPEIDFREEDWAKMEKKLDTDLGHKAGFRRYLYSLLAALITTIAVLLVWMNVNNSGSYASNSQPNNQLQTPSTSIKPIDKLSHADGITTPIPKGDTRLKIQETADINDEPDMIETPANTSVDANNNENTANKTDKADKEYKSKQEVTQNNSPAVAEKHQPVSSEESAPAVSDKPAQKEKPTVVPNSRNSSNNKTVTSKNKPTVANPAGIPFGTKQTGEQIAKNNLEPLLTENKGRKSSEKEKITYGQIRDNEYRGKAASKQILEEAVNTDVWQPNTIAEAVSMLSSLPVIHLPVNILLHEKYAQELANKSVDTAGQITPDVLTDPSTLAKERVNYKFAVSFMLSPDLSAVRVSQLTKPGTNIGVMLEYKLTSKISVATGFVRSTKIYDARIQDYSPPPGQWTYYVKPVEIKANCTVLDIPVNIRYTILSRQNYNLFASTGLSSYLMLTEDYRYIYDVDDSHLRKSWHVVNKNKHYFKVYNLSAGYEQILGKHFSLQAEPFVKIPTAGVGFGKIKLWSAGMFFSARYRFGK